MDTGTATGRDRRGAGQGLWAGAAYDGHTSAIAEARSFAGAFLERARTEHGVTVPAQVYADCRLIVSELVTNAFRYAPGPSALNLEIRGPVLEITAWDTSTAWRSSAPCATASTPGASRWASGSTGLTALIGAYRRTQQEHTSFTLCGTSEQLARVFQIVGIDRIMSTYDTVEHAAHALSAPSGLAG